MLDNQPQNTTLTREEEELLALAVEEYNDLFPSIMILKKDKFLPSLERFIQISLAPKSKSYSQGSLSKILKIIQLKYYEPDIVTVTKLVNSIYDIKKQERFTTKNFIPHCDLTRNPVHKCGEKMLIIDKYLLCLNCRAIYRFNCVLFHCDNCKVDYYTSITDKEANVRYRKATWKKYHCPNIINDIINCTKCRNCLYLNNQNMLCCLLCNITYDRHSLKLKCKVCGSDFIPETKEYNPLEFKNLQMVKKQALFECTEAKPEYLPCCRIDNKEIQNYKFYHKKECNGILYLGTFNSNKIVVCSKCLNAYNYDNHLWFCPLCKMRINVNANKDIANHDKGITTTNKQEFVKKDSKKSFVYEDDDKPSNTNVERSYGRKLTGETGNEIDRRRTRGLSSKGPTTIEEQMKHTSGMNMYKLAIENPNEQNKSPGIMINKRSKFATSNDPVPRNPNYDNKKLGNISLNIQAISSLSNVPGNNTKSPNAVSNLGKIFIPMGKRRHSNNNVLNANQLPKEQNANNNTKDDSTFSSDDYTVINHIGEGTFGKIYKVEDRNKKIFAMKKIIANSEKEIDALKKELDMLTSLNKLKINLVNIYGIECKKLDKTTHVMYVLMDLAERDWEKEIDIRSRTKSFYTEQELLHILKELVYTFAELQRHNISHRDIKPQNILLFPDKRFKIADFGEAKEILASQRQNTVKQTIRGTELYMSPILFQALQNKDSNEQYTKHNTFKSDVFSLGLCFLLAATLSFNCLFDIREKTDMLSMKLVLTKYLNRRYSMKFTDVLYKMLEFNERERCDFTELNQITERF